MEQMLIEMFRYYSAVLCIC